MLKIGQNIKKLRELKNVSRQYIADGIGVTLKTYSNIENDLKSPEVETVEKIAQILDISLTKIFNFDEKVILNNNGQHVENFSNNINQYGVKENELYVSLVKNKDELIHNQNETITFLKQELEKKNVLIEKLINQK